MLEEYYVKIVLGKWFDPRIKKAIDDIDWTINLMVTLYANGAKDTQIDGIDCSKFNPKIINVVFGHQTRVTYDGYFKINGTKHFSAILPMVLPIFSKYAGLL